MPQLNLKPSHKVVRDYYATLQQYDQHDITHEGAVSNPFAFLLDACAKQVNATLVPQYPMRAPKGNRIIIDGTVLNEIGLPLAYWEAKDMDDDLARAVIDKREAGYPLDNTLFQNPQRVILYQNDAEVLDLDITEPANLIAALQYLFAYVPPELDNWQTAVTDFREHVPDLANRLKELIEQRHKTDPAFKKAFTDFYDTCRTSINPELSQDAVEKMRLSRDKTQLKYNDFLTLDGIPSEVYAYKLGNRSALEWVVDQYRVKTDKRSGVVNDPNRADEPRYIVDLVGRVMTVSLRTMEVIEGLPAL